MRTFHEAPLYYMPLVDRLTDGTYYLVHLFEENEDYLEHAMMQRRDRHVILDNSVFELGEAFTADSFAYWVDLTRPTDYIIPDVVGDGPATIESVKNWVREYSGILPGNTMAVVQGATYEEMVECYRAVEPLVDKVSFPFRSRFYKQQGAPDASQIANWAHGRVDTINRMESEGVINDGKPHHLLGCSQITEFYNYRDKRWIDSVDTSSPVMWGLEGKKYDNNLDYKPNAKLFTMIDWEPADKTEDIIVTDAIVNNIKYFDEICNGN